MIEENFWRDSPQPQPCEDCSLSARRRWDGFMADCDGCKARMAARLPQFKAACNLRDSRHPPYVKLLHQFGLTHEQVLAAAQADWGCQAHSERLLTTHRERTAAEFKQEAGQ